MGEYEIACNEFDDAGRVETSSNGVNSEGGALSLTQAEVQAWLAESRSNTGRNIVKIQSYPIGSIASLGVAFEPIASIAQTLAGPGAATGGSGLYIASNIAPGAHLAAATDGSGLLGSVVRDGSGLVGQARFTPVPFDPVTACMAVAMLEMNKKLDAIQETQQELFDYLVGKDKAEDRGNLTQLADILDSYQYNSQSAEFKRAKIVLVQDIRRDADQRIEHLRDLVGSQIEKRKLVHLNKNAEVMQGKIMSCMKDYQLALYLYGFSTFLEVLLFENYDSRFLESERMKIENRVSDYNNVRETCHTVLERYADSSVQAHVLGGVGKAGKFVGKVVAKTPVGDKTLIDEAFDKLGEAASDAREKGVKRLSFEVVEEGEVGILAFAENIRVFDVMRNHPSEFLIEGDTLHVRLLEA